VPLIAQSAWWIAPAFVLALFMVYAMMEHMATLLVKRPRQGGVQVDAAELRRRLVGLNNPARPYRLIDGKVSDLELDWTVVDESWATRFSGVKLSTVYYARLLLDDVRHEARWFEVLRSSNVFLGFDGWIPRLNFGFWIQAGFMSGAWRGTAYGIQPGFPARLGGSQPFSVNIDQVKQDVRGVVTRSGWTFRPTVFWFQTKRRSVAFTEALLPAFMKEWPARRFWRIVYPASFVATVGWIWWVAGGGRSTLLAMAAFSAFWWAIWGFILLIFKITSGEWAPGRRNASRGDRNRGS
jgi:hypothetical protein